MKPRQKIQKELEKRKKGKNREERIKSFPTHNIVLEPARRRSVWDLTSDKLVLMGKEVAMEKKIISQATFTMHRIIRKEICFLMSMWITLI